MLWSPRPAANARLVRQNMLAALIGNTEGVLARGSRSTQRPEPAAVGCALLDTHLVAMLVRHVILRAAQDQSAQYHPRSLNGMEVLILLLGTGRDHGLGTPADVPDDCHWGDLGRPEACRE